MFISVFLGPMSRGPHEDQLLIDLCLDQAIQAADAGFCMVTFGEQHYNGYEPYCNPFLMAARLAPYLKRAYFGTTICPIVFHHPLRLAEDINVVEALTGGKLMVGMSAGRVGFSPDFANFGLDPERRIEIFDSKLGAMLKAWAHKPGDSPLVINTEWDRCTLTGRMTPMSVRSPHPLLAIGTNFDGMVEQTGQRGWPVFLGPCALPEAQRKFELHRASMRQAGHSETHIQEVATQSLVTRHVIVGETEDEAWQRAEQMLGRMPFLKREQDPRSLRELAQVDLSSTQAKLDPHVGNAQVVQSWLICGTPDSVCRQVLAYEAAGIPHLNTRFTVGTYLPDDIRRSYALFASEVLPRLNPQSFAPPPPRVFAPPTGMPGGRPAMPARA